MSRLALLALAGCAAPGVPEGWLDLEEGSPERVRPRDYGQIWLDPEGSAQRPERPVPFELGAPIAVVDLDESRVRVTAYPLDFEERVVDLLLWIESSDLHDLILEDGLWATAAPDGSADAGVSWGAGTPVERLEERDELVRVRQDDGQVRIEAWLPLDAVGRVWSARPSLPPPPTRAEHALRLGARILDAPHGAPLATVVAQEHPPLVERLGDGRDGWVPVAWSAGDRQLAGWVEDDALEPPWTWPDPVEALDAFELPRLCGMMRGNVLPNAAIYDRPDGAIVGQTRDRVFGDFESPGRWGRIRAPTPWGLVEAWVPPGSDDPKVMARATPEHPHRARSSRR